MKRKKRIGTVGKAIGCLFFLMVSLFPIYWLVAMAIRPTDEMRGHIALIPQSLTGIHFAELFSTKNFGTATIAEAKREADSILANANAQAQNGQSAALTAECDALRRQVEDLRASARSYRDKLLQLLQQQRELLDQNSELF